MTSTKYRVSLTVTIQREILPDCDPDLSWLEDDKPTGPDDFYLFDGKRVGVEEYSRQRIEAYNRGEWSMIGIRAVARSVETGEIVATSSGLWGIEDDSGEEYLEEVFAQEAAELLSTLHAERV